MKCIVVLLIVASCASAQYVFYSGALPAYTAAYSGYVPILRRKRSAPEDVELEPPKRLGWKCLLRRLLKRGYAADDLDFGYGGFHMMTKREAPAPDLDGTENRFYHNAAFQHPNLHALFGR